MSIGKVWLVGAGPGDAGLFTLKGLEVLNKAEVPVVRSVCREVKHVLSHRVIYANLYEVTLSENLTSFGDFQKIKVEELEQYAISRLVQTLLQALNGKY